MKENTKSIDIKSEIKNIKKVSSEILNSLAAYGIDADTLFDIRLCTEEAVRNAIVHGNRLDKKRLVRINYRISDGGINIEVEDEGTGFDAVSVPDPTGDNNLTKESGRGVCIIKKLMDRADYNERGNKLIMEKAFRKA